MATRGKFIFITDESTFASIEFNGEMFPDGKGSEAYEILKNSNDVNDFRSKVEKFNDNYGRIVENVVGVVDPMKLNFTKESYFDLWFSDYLYIKNNSSRSVLCLDYNSEEFEIKSGDTIILNYGELV